MNNENLHKSVLLKESVQGLNIRDNKIYVDATLGYGGHTKEILRRIKSGKLFAFDQDIDAIHYCELSLPKENLILINTNFKNMKESLEKFGITKVDGIIFDLGLSSPQIDNKDRGFSFMQDAKLDMRMNKSNDLTAEKVVNEYDLTKLIQIFYEYGEEKYSKQIAKNIINKRPITSTLELVNVIKDAVPIKYFREKHPERRIFQAIRIEVNDELGVLKKVLPEAVDLLNEGGRICVITFHSLEDRIVKQVFNKYSKVDDLVKGLPEIPDAYKPKLRLINKKPILPSEEEIKENSRSKSAKLRIAERI